MEQQLAGAGPTGVSRRRRRRARRRPAAHAAAGPEVRGPDRGRSRGPGPHARWPTPRRGPGTMLADAESAGPGAHRGDRAHLREDDLAARVDPDATGRRRGDDRPSPRDRAQPAARGAGRHAHLGRRARAAGRPRCWRNRSAHAATRPAVAARRRGARVAAPDRVAGIGRRRSAGQPTGGRAAATGVRRASTPARRPPGRQPSSAGRPSASGRASDAESRARPSVERAECRWPPPTGASRGVADRVAQPISVGTGRLGDPDGLGVGHR